MPYYMMNYWGPFSFLGELLRLALWVIVIIFIIKLFKRRKNWHHIWPSRAIETLRERYAKGEISKEEYEERKKVLLERDY